MRRRTFLASALALPAMRASRATAKLDLAAIERTRVLRAANKYLGEAPVTVTAAGSPRSAGGKHDFFSEGDYWRSEEHTSELQSLRHLVCRLLLETKYPLLDVRATPRRGVAAPRLRAAARSL